MNNIERFEHWWKQEGQFLRLERCALALESWKQAAPTQGADARPVAIDRSALIRSICDAIRAADEKSVDEANYMLDSDDCIKLIETFATRDASSSGWKLAMRVLQSDLYATLDDAERAECDALIRANPYIAPRGKT